MVALDSSAIVAVLNGEEDGPQIQEVLARAPRVLVGAPTLLELSIVMGASRWAALEELLEVIGVNVVPFTAEHAQVAREAYVRYGRGSGSQARLNFGDVMSYAVAKVAGEPLLFKGDDFPHTDIELAAR